MRYLVVCLLMLVVVSSTKALSMICVSSQTVQDYLDIAQLYASAKLYHRALEYINMIEPYDSYNLDLNYKKACILNDLKYEKSAKKVMQKTILLSPAFACSDLAIELFEPQNICKKWNDKILE